MRCIMLSLVATLICDYAVAASTSTCQVESEFTCATSGDCINREWMCDGDKDCSDSSDELNCPGPCPIGEVRDGKDCISLPECNIITHFTCGNGLCVPNLWVCDGTDDCGDNSDESCNRRSCDVESEFTCVTDGHCINGKWRCDGAKDCSDGSDEQNCPEIPTISCAEDEVRCVVPESSQESCLPQKKQCDGYLDCTSGEDERECPGEPPCRLDQWRCQSGSCISLSQRCDFRDDCGDNSDEEQCRKKF